MGQRAVDRVAETYLGKALESLATAHAEAASGRFNSCANRCYYACFQAAIAALLHEDEPLRVQWGHDFVQAQFAGQLIGRRKLYGSELRDMLTRLYELRERADYSADSVTETQAMRAVRRAEALVRAVEQRLRRGRAEP